MICVEICKTIRNLGLLATVAKFKTVEKTFANRDKQNSKDIQKTKSKKKNPDFIFFGLMGNCCSSENNVVQPDNRSIGKGAQNHEY
jgi:hypothetical protein